MYTCYILSIIRSDLRKKCKLTSHNCCKSNISELFQYFFLFTFFFLSAQKKHRHNAFNLGDLQEDQTGDWWVYYGFNSSPTAVGKFPKSLFTGLPDSTADFAFGGYTNNARTQLTPPMGSGSSQTGSAASFSNLRYILQDGTVSAIAENLPSRVNYMR